MTKAIKICTRLSMVWISKILTILAPAFYLINLEWYLKSNYISSVITNKRFFYYNPNLCGK